MKNNLPTPADVAAALRRMTPDFDEWLAVRTPLTPKEQPFPLLTGPFVDTNALTLEQFSDLSDCYMFAVRHGWASFESKHGLTRTRPSGDQAALMPDRPAIMALLNFRTDGLPGDPHMPAYWRERLAQGWTLPINLAGIYCVAFRQGWFLRAMEEDAKNE